MSLKYKDISEVQVSREDGFRISTINQAVRRLAENDQSFFGPSSALPGVWERRWYNDERNSSLYYKKGDAVWVNTEQADKFVAAHVADIDMYIRGCAEAQYQFDSLSAAADRAGLYRLRKDIALGLGDFAGRGIYFLGDLLSPVQLKVSKCDGNSSTPNDPEKWEDFFDRSYDRSFYRGEILSRLEEQLSAVYQKHLREYHLSGLSDPEKFLGRYLKADFSNAQALQKFTNHAWYQPDMTGLDHAAAFVKKDLGGGQCQWFRIWKSGLLEHGGIVKVDERASQCGTNDASRRMYRVRLGWAYGGKTAPVYDYPASGIGGFYSHDSLIYTGSDVSARYSPAADALGRERRYVVDLSPLQSLSRQESSLGPYQPVDCDRFLRYPGKEVTEMNDSSFTFVYAPGISMYSYYVRGFTVNKAKQY